MTTEPFALGEWEGEVYEGFGDTVPEILRAVSSGEPGEVLKEGKARKVWVARTPEGTFCIKEFRHPSRWDRVARWFRGSRAGREWRCLRYLRRNGIPVPQPVIRAEKGGKETATVSLLVTRFEEGCRNLGDVLRSRRNLPVETRRFLCREVGILLAKLHGCGALHGDLHAGNILIGNEIENPRVLLVDLHQVSLKRRIPWNKRLWNMADLLCGIQPLLTPGDKHRCMKWYLQTLTDWKPYFPEEREARRSMGRAVEIFAAKTFRRKWRSRLSKCTQHGKRFHRFREGGLSGWIRAEWDTPEMRELLGDPEGRLDSESCDVLKHTPTTTVARVPLPAVGKNVFLKRYNRKSAWERTKNLFRRSRAMKVWRSGYALELLGIPTPRTIAAVERRMGPFVLESFVVTEWIEGGVGFDDFYRERCSPDSPVPYPVEERNRLERQVARLFRELHRHRISHGDLKGRNILLDPSADPPWSPCFVDLDAMSLRPVRFRRCRINDLARLLFSVYPIPSPYRCVRFFKTYSSGSPHLWEERRRWWKAIWKRTERKLKEKGIPVV